MHRDKDDYIALSDQSWLQPDNVTANVKMHQTVSVLYIRITSEFLFGFSNCFSLFPTQDTDHTLSSKKPPLSLFSAADIIQVVPSYSVPLGLQWKDAICGGKWINSLTHKVNKSVSKPYDGSQALSKSFCFDNNTTTLQTWCTSFLLNSKLNSWKLLPQPQP